MKLKLILLLAVACISAAQANAQVYAITNARIVTVAGPAVEKGTVVMRNGLIESVGASAKSLATRLSSMERDIHVYPGFIDALTSLGIQAQPQRAAGGGPQAQAQQARSSCLELEFSCGSAAGGIRSRRCASWRSPIRCCAKRQDLRRS